MIQFSIVFHLRSHSEAGLHAVSANEILLRVSLFLFLYKDSRQKFNFVLSFFFVLFAW